LHKNSDITVTSVISTLITDGTNELTIGNILAFNNKEVAFKEDVPKLVTLTKAEYQALIANDELDEDAYYHVTDDSDTYMLASQMVDYYTKTAIESYIAGNNYTKAEVDNLIQALSFYTQE